MSVGLYMDVTCARCRDPRIIVAWHVLTSQLDGTTEMVDPDMMDRASALARVLVSQDDDLLAEAARRQRQGIQFSGLFYAHQLGITLGRFINDLEVLALVGQAEDYQNRVEFLPL